MSKGLGIKNNYKMVGVKPTVGGKQLKTIPINPQSGASKFELKMKKGLGIPGYLTGGQAKIDANKDGKITGEDFKILKAKKKGMKVEKANVGLLAKLASDEGARTAGLLGLGMLAKKKFSTGGENKIKKVMGEFKDKTLKSSSGKKVTSRKQAIAIALSEARKKQKSGKKKS
jgi:hypothetical protein